METPSDGGTKSCSNGPGHMIMGIMFLKYFSITCMFNTKSDLFTPKMNPYFHGNRKSNAI